MKLLSQIVLLITIMIFSSVFFVSVLFTGMVDDLTEKSLGNQAMTVAKLIAENEEIIHAFEDQNPSKTIQPIAEMTRELAGAGYVVIGNRDGIRYSHHNPINIGKTMGTSNEPVLKEGKSIIYEGTGISGNAIKAKTPIINSKGDVIGVSSVGFLTKDVKESVAKNKASVLKLTLVILLLGVAGAFLIARRVKNLIFNLEPEEISFMFKEKEATLEAIRDAIVTVDSYYQITSMNKRARELLKNHYREKEVTIENSRMRKIIDEVISFKMTLVNQNIILGHQLYIVDSSPIIEEDKVKGVVLTIRPISEIEQINNEVSKIKTISENMRAQNHEYLNKLNTIYGLLNLKQYDRAIEMISGEVRERQDIINFLMSSVKDPLIAACLLGKINRSKELRVSLVIDEESNLIDIPSTEISKSLVTILGNIIDNAMEAVRDRDRINGKVKISFTDIGKDLIFEIEDSGYGIDIELQQIVFTDGYTTKSGENHGIGLAIVKDSIDVLNGHIYMSKSELGGAKFTIVIPKV
ncbi:ATP-binding protein [Metabacillus herbersteinensis]